MMVFGHQKCCGKHRVLIGSPKGVPGTPDKRYGPYGLRGETHQPQRGWCAPPPIWAGQIGEGNGKEERKKGIGFPLPPLPFLLRIGIGKGGGRIGRTPSRIPPTWGTPLDASPPLQPIYMKGAPLEHTPTIVSHVRRPPPQFTPPVISS